MKCPNCNKDMIKGNLRCHGYNPWPALLKNIFWYEKESVVTGLKNKINFGNRFEAYLCKKCKKVVFDY